MGHSFFPVSKNSAEVAQVLKLENLGQFIAAAVKHNRHFRATRKRFWQEMSAGLTILAVLCECVREDRAGLLSVLHSVLFQLGSLGDNRERSRGKDFNNTHT